MLNGSRSNMEGVFCLRYKKLGHIRSFEKVFLPSIVCAVKVSTAVSGKRVCANVPAVI